MFPDAPTDPVAVRTQELLMDGGHCPLAFVGKLDPTARTWVITVRVPDAYHRQLLREAHKEELSLNKLCIKRLITAATLGRIACRRAHDELAAQHSESSGHVQGAGFGVT